MNHRRAVRFVVASIAVLVVQPAEGKRRVPFAGPVSATVVDVLDGDTFLADAEIWPGQTLRVNIRIRGIDAPEMKSRCQEERVAALRARDLLAQLMSGGTVSLSNIGGAKYYGRVLADVRSDNVAVSDVLLDQGVVRRYGGGRRDGWCG